MITLSFLRKKRRQYPIRFVRSEVKQRGVRHREAHYKLYGLISKQFPIIVYEESDWRQREGNVIRNKG
jgi:hypothetical protein